MPETGAGWRRVLAQLVHQADAISDRARQRLRTAGRAERPRLVLPYLGFGTPQRLQFSGRVIEDAGFVAASPSDRDWTNLVEFVKRLESDEVAGARLVARFGDLEHSVVTDDEGFFGGTIEPADPLPLHGWATVQLRLADSTAQADAQVLLPPPSARFGVISDIDDTVVQTHVRNRLKMLLTLARSNAHTRKPFAGVAALYRALHQGAGGAEGNPLFYVSSSPWNLYTPLVEFLGVQRIPLGPLLLKDYGDHTLFASRDHYGHKRAAIERIFETYPGLDFVLIGDSGEQDPEIYSALVHDHPRRVRVIYIRAMHSGDAARGASIDALIEAVRPTGTQLVLVPDSAFAAAHAAGEGLIAAQALSDVRADTLLDGATP